MSGSDHDIRVPPGAEVSDSAIFPPVEAKPFPFLRPARGPGELGWLGDYRVTRVLGSGGMGIVFLAEDAVLHRPVALKVLRPEVAADPDNRERFLREARAAAALADDHIFTIYQVGVADGVPFLASQLLHGESLQDRLDRQPRLDVPTVLRVARDTAAGLAAAHAAGLVHRDIKPANVWLEADRPGGPFRRAKLLDFGLARRLGGEASLTSTGLIIGTPNYMAPEQAGGYDVDHRADLFSLGVVLYTALAGELPFPGRSAIQVMLAVTAKDPPPLVARNAEVPPAVTDLIGRLMAKDPAARPKSAREVVEAVDAIQAGVPIPAPPPTVVPTPALPVAEPGETVSDGPTPTATTPRPPAPGRRARQRRSAPVTLGVALVAVFVAAVAGFVFRGAVSVPTGEPIRVGVLHSRTGSMAVSENPIIDATRLAVEELNGNGGVLGRPVETVIADGASEPDRFAREAERLLTQDRVAAIFGCQTSPSRKAVRDVVETHKGLLFFPTSYEGLEQSRWIVYVGAAMNQKTLPAVEYLVRSLGKKRLFVVGSDLVSPRAATEIIRDHLAKVLMDGELVGEAFVPFGSTDMIGALDAIAAAHPDAVVNILNGSSNFYFYEEFRKRGWTPKNLPTLSISLAESDLRGVDVRAMAGDYLAATYFQSIDRPQNRAFLEKWRSRYGNDRAVTDNMVAAYTGVHLWAKAVSKAGTTDPEVVTEAVGGVEFEGPSGRITIDPENRHAWRPWRVGQVRANGTVEEVAASAGSVRADPFPATRTRHEWERLLTGLYVGWGGKWQAPAQP